MINSEDDIYIDFKSSLTKDEAVAKLLGWLNGNRRVKIVKVPDGVLSPTFFAKLHALEGSLQEMLETYRTIASNEFVAAFEKENEYTEQVQALDGVVKEWDAVIDKAAIYFMDIDDELSKGEKSALRTLQITIDRDAVPHITTSSLNEWALAKYGISILGAITSSLNIPKVQQEPTASVEKPWFEIDSQDPLPEQPWYTPARYFARQLINEDSTLLIKTDLLTQKLVQSLSKVGIYKRGGKKPFNPDTIKKALSNVKL